MRRLRLAVLVLLAAPFGLSSSLADPNGASGPEFKVNQFHAPNIVLPYYRFPPGAALADSGDFLVVWGSEGFLFGRAFDAGSMPRGGDITIGVGSYGYQTEDPDVSAANGQFVAVWSSSTGSYYYGEVQAQRFGLQGQLQGSAIEVAQSVPGYRSEVAAEEGGDFIVAWDSGLSFVRLRRFAGTGQPSWPMQSISGTPGSVPLNPDVAVDALGNFTVIWEYLTPATSTKHIRGRRFDSSGLPLGADFQISASGWSDEPAIASLPDGGFIAVWVTLGPEHTDIFARIYNLNAQPLGEQFLVNTTTAGYQEYPDVSADDRGNFLVAWETQAPRLTPTVIRARWFDRLGVPTGGDFQVNQNFTTGQGTPTVTTRDDGESLVAWFSDQISTSGTSIRARRFCAIPSASPPEDLAVCSGSTATFSTTTNGRQPFTFQWVKAGAPLQDGGRITGATSPTLVVSEAQASDAGSYGCVVIDACPEPQAVASSAAQLTIEPPPAAVVDLTLQAEDNGAVLHFLWEAAAGAADYVVRSDVVPDGGFPVVVGSASDPAIGLSVPMTSETQFYLVAARNPLCGEGPLR